MQKHLVFKYSVCIGRRAGAGINFHCTKKAKLEKLIKDYIVKQAPKQLFWQEIKCDFFSNAERLPWISFLNFPDIQENEDRLLPLCSLEQNLQKSSKKHNWKNFQKPLRHFYCLVWVSLTSPAELHACKTVQGSLTASWGKQQHLGASHPSLCMEKGFLLCCSQNHSNDTPIPWRNLKICAHLS